jgi:nucleotide-binding universal stress UspA family protein
VADYPHFGGGTWPEEAMDFETYDQVLVAEQEEAERYLHEVRNGLAETGLTVRTIVRHGNPYVTLLDLADKLAAAAIVIASHGRGGFKRLVLGSVAMQLVSHSTVPVFLVRATTTDKRHIADLKRLLVPLDGSVLAQRARRAVAAELRG